MANLFSERLRVLRAKTRLTQRQVAKHLGVSPATLGMYEAGKREPNIDVLVSIAAFYETNLDYLLGRTNDPAPSKGGYTDGKLPLSNAEYKDLTPVERESVDRITREFERLTIELFKTIRNNQE